MQLLLRFERYGWAAARSGGVPGRIAYSSSSHSPQHPGRKGPSQRLVRDHRCWLQPQQAAGDAWCGILGMRRFSLIGEF